MLLEGIFNYSYVDSYDFYDQMHFRYDGTNFLRSCEVYDNTTDTWTIIAPMNVKRSRVALGKLI